MQEPGPYRDAAHADVVDLIHLQCVNPGAHLRTESCRQHFYDQMEKFLKWKQTRR